MVTSNKPSIKEIRAKVEAGERLNMDDGLLLYSPEVHLNDVGELANVVRERKKRQFRLLQHQRSLESDERLRLPLYFLCVPVRFAGSQGLPHERRANFGPRAGSHRRRLHGNAHRRRIAPPDGF